VTNYEILEKAAQEIFNAKTPEEIEHYVKFLVYLTMG
jgi:hypothetical protein